MRQHCFSVTSSAAGVHQPSSLGAELHPYTPETVQLRTCEGSSQTCLSVRPCTRTWTAILNFASTVLSCCFAFCASWPSSAGQEQDEQEQHICLWAARVPLCCISAGQWLGGTGGNQAASAAPVSGFLSDSCLPDGDIK